MKAEAGSNPLSDWIAGHEVTMTLDPTKPSHVVLTRDAVLDGDNYSEFIAAGGTIEKNYYRLIVKANSR